MESSVHLEEYVSLAPMTTMKIGGRARFFLRATSEDDVAAGVSFAARRALPLFVLGGGSNILVSESEFRGLVLQIAMRGILVQPLQENSPENSIIFSVAAGEDWDGFVKYCVGWGLAGVECLSGIPGSVGGAPIQNIGAYGQEVSQTIVSVKVFDRESGAIRSLSNAECEFGYRSSIFNTTMRDTYIVLSVDFEMIKGGEPTVTYRDLLEHFAGRTPSLSETRDAVLEIRRAKSMVIDPKDPNSRSVGSFFKNPIIGVDKFDSLSEEIGNVPGYPVEGELVKVPAAWLILKAGFRKGYSRGNAGISSNHPLALVNLGGATANEIIMLKNEIQAAVEAQFGITLIPEPVFVGF